MDSRIIHLFLKYLNEECTAEELEEVFLSLENGTCQEEWKIAVSQDADHIIHEDLQTGQTGLTEAEANQLFARIESNLLEKDHPVQRKLVSKLFTAWFKYSAAAALILIGLGAYFYFIPVAGISAQYAQDIPPGGNKASLTLANGSTISLTEAKDGQLAEQAGVKISKTKDGQLIYKVDEQSAEKKEIQYNTVTTPKGGQYKVELPDGTSAWLNAASSLRFPVTFSGAKERKVQLSGEAYFEVAKDKDHPFIVSTSRQEVQVLGTHFIINAYNDEPITRTVLLEGAVQVSPVDSEAASDLNRSVRLKPGQQSILQQHVLQVTAVDIEEAMAWKNGYFRFNDEDLESIMRKLARWYNIDVVFQGYKNNGGFTGTISRNKNIIQVLSMLEKTKGIHFKIEERRITVMP